MKRLSVRHRKPGKFDIKVVNHACQSFDGLGHRSAFQRVLHLAPQERVAPQPPLIWRRVEELRSGVMDGIHADLRCACGKPPVCDVKQRDQLSANWSLPSSDLGTRSPADHARIYRTFTWKNVSTISSNCL
jgi:hypothetical protein